MPRSRISENQVVDKDFLSEDEFATSSGIINQKILTVSGSLQNEIDTLKFKDLYDTPAGDYPVTVSGEEGYIPHIKKDGSGVDYTTLSGISTLPADTNPPENEINGKGWYDTNTKLVYYYDKTRDKWLTVSRYMLVYGHSGSADGVDLGISSVTSNNTGYYLSYPATITGIFVRALSGKQNKLIKIRVRELYSDGSTSSLSVLTTFNLSNLIYINTDANIDVDYSNLVQIRVAAAGSSISNVICQLEIAYRKDT